MISETRFAKSYSSIWRGLTPTMELFVRKANLRLAERNWPQVISQAAPSSRAIINQVAFRLVLNFIRETANLCPYDTYLQSLENLDKACSEIYDGNVLKIADREEALILSKRIQRQLFEIERSPVRLSPPYSGCGVINSCFGDAITQQGKIIELKDGDRPFRAYEFRQLVLYAALHFNSTGKMPTAIEVINSRRGLSITVGIDDFTNEIAGQSCVDLLSEVIRVITDFNIYQQ